MRPDLRSIAESVVAGIQRLTAGSERPVLVALDGFSGSGKSMLAGRIAQALDVAWVLGDDFFSANITDAEWDARTPAARASDAIDWRRLRTEALEPLLAGKPAKWRPFDFASATRPDGTYAMCAEAVEREARPVIILDGTYSTRPELADLIDLSVLVDVPVAVCRQRQVAREDPTFLARWHARWDAAEEWYFTRLRPKSSFDLVVANA